MLERRPFTLACGAVLALALAGCRPAASPPRRVFLITVDTLRADHLGFHGYPRDTSPNLDALAARSLVFERAIVQWPKTGASLASVFTGRYPQSTGLTHKAAIELPADYLTLPELFRQHGYTTAAVVANAVLSSELGWSEGFDEFVEPWKLGGSPPSSPTEWRELLDAPSINEQALPLLERLAGAERLFVWIHYMDPHAPYLLPEGIENPFLGDAYDRAQTSIGGWFPKVYRIGGQRRLSFYRAQYAANVWLVDHFAHEALERARELGLLDDALVIFTADHGESLGERKYLGHGRSPYNDGSHVPLFIWDSSSPGPGRRVDRPVELVDLYPTLRDLLDPDAEVAGLEGTSLLGFLDGERAGRSFRPDSFRFAFSEAGDGSAPWEHFRSVQDERWKLVYHPAVETPKGPRPLWMELYDLETDPGETRNLIEIERAEARRLRSVLLDWMVESTAPAPGETAGLSEQTIEALRGLGYVQ